MKKLLLFLLTIILITGCKNSYYCPDDYLETDDYCEKEIIEEPEVKISCKFGYSLEEDKCVYESKEVAGLKYVCSSGYTLYGTVCKKNGGVVSSKCGSNHVEVNGYCFSDLPASQTYDCIDGVKEGSYCVTKTYSEPIKEYLCESGYNLIDQKCIKKDRIDKIKK